MDTVLLSIFKFMSPDGYTNINSSHASLPLTRTTSNSGRQTKLNLDHII